MIQELRHLRPQIDFGMGITTLSHPDDVALTVWQNVLYNTGAYTFTLMASGAQVTVVSPFEYRLVYPTPGSYSINLIATATGTGANLSSNILYITIT